MFPTIGILLPNVLLVSTAEEPVAISPLVNDGNWERLLEKDSGRMATELVLRTSSEELSDPSSMDEREMSVPTDDCIIEAMEGIWGC